MIPVSLSARHIRTTNIKALADLRPYDSLAGAITTRDGKLVITLSETVNHNLNYTSGMLQSWNKLCFSGSMYYEGARGTSSIVKSRGAKSRLLRQQQSCYSLGITKSVDSGRESGHLAI
jgi:hypothetical protein